MKKSIFAALASLMFLPVALQAAESLSTLLVVPSRQTMIQLAFDMQSLRQAEVVCWQPGPSPDSPVLNYWNEKAKKWDALTIEQFKSHARLPQKPQKIIFIGLDTPPVLTECFPSGIARFETFDRAMLVNNLDAFYSFSNGEWRLLSKRYNFMIRDVNEKLRSRNRYANPPASEGAKSKRQPVIFDKNPPPAEVIELEAVPAEEPVVAPESVAPESDAPESVKTETIDVEPAKPDAVKETEAELKPDVPAAVESKAVEAPGKK
jgi:hypothetical protein